MEAKTYSYIFSVHFLTRFIIKMWFFDENSRVGNTFWKTLLNNSG